MKLWFVFLFCLCGLSSCFLFKDYKKTSFSYVDKGQPASIPIIYPKGYTKKEVTDSGGRKEEYYYYSGGAVFYIAYLMDTTTLLQPLNQSLHQPQIHRRGGRVYKGMDSNGLYYREIEQGRFRVGYRDVPERLEWRFDSASNFASLQKK